MSRDDHENLKSLGGIGGVVGGYPSSASIAEILEQQRRVAAMQRYPGVYNGPYPSTQGPPPPLRTMPSNHEMLCMRMRWTDETTPGFDYVAIHSAGEKVFVWVITKDAQAVTIEDEAGLYPSDALVTKLRMLQQGT